jgi:Tol biopolymer transport system component
VKPVVYQSNTTGQWEIFKAEADGSNEVRLTDNAGADKAPHWQPSGQYITFQSDRDENWEVYTSGRRTVPTR